MNYKILFLIIQLLNGAAILWNSLVNGWLNPWNIALVFYLCLVFAIKSSIQKFLGDLSLKMGRSDLKSEEEIKNQIAATKDFVKEFKEAVSGIDEIGSVSFLDVINKVSDESVRNSLIAANQKIIDLRQKESETNWITNGVAIIAELKQKGNGIKEYTFQVILNVVKYLGANQGGFFLLREEGDVQFLELTASYAYGKKKFLEKRINAGEGLVGQVIYEKEIIYMTDVPKDYVKITSGLGEALPRSVCIVPVISEGKILGAFEIASFEKLSHAAMQYLKKISETIGYNLGSIETQRRTELLLSESQQMAQEVKAQEEELRQNMEELTATQEQMRRKETEMDAVMASLSTVELDLHGNVIHANPVFLGITGYTLSDIQGKLYKSLIPQHGNDPIQYEMMWSSILAGRAFSGEFRIVNKSQKEMWMAGNFTPILNENGNPYKVMVISLFTTQDKEKLFELQEMVAAIKDSFPMVEISQDLTFKSASDLFLSELGIRRMELRKMESHNVFMNGSLSKVEAFLKDTGDKPSHTVLDIQSKDGSKKRFNSTLIKVSNGKDLQKKGLLILRNMLEQNEY